MLRANCGRRAVPPRPVSLRGQTGVTVGAKRIDIAAKPTIATGIRFSAGSGFGVPTGLKISVFAPEPCKLDSFDYPL